MKHFLFAILASFLLGSATFLRMSLITPHASQLAVVDCDGNLSAGCTVFTVSKGKQVFFGGNDDYINPDSYYRVDPGGAQGYGPMWVGTSLPGECLLGGFKNRG